MATPADLASQQVDLAFPLAGIDSTQPVAFQRPLTTRDALNVVSIEPLAQRARGGRRPGLSRYVDQRLPSVPDPTS